MYYTALNEILSTFVKEICRERNVLCISPDNSILAKLVFTWLENFLYIDPKECAEDIECVKKLFEIHGEVMRLALEDRYLYYVDKDLLIKIIEKLLSL
jgi:hypothetical protein